MGQPPDMRRLIEWSVGNYGCCMPVLEGRQCVRVLGLQASTSSPLLPCRAGSRALFCADCSPQNISCSQCGGDIWDGVEWLSHSLIFPI